MGVKIVRVCDITGEPLSSPVKLGFRVSGEEVLLEVNMDIAQKLMFAFANRLSNDQINEATEEVFGSNWLDKFKQTVK